MYLYFDKLGKLKEIINDESLRQGSDNVNTIYCFFEGDRIVNSVDFSILRNGDSQATTFDQDTDSPVVKEIPYDENRSLYYFKYFTNYTFYKYTLTQTNLSVSGVIKITIRAYDNANKIFALGLYVGNVEKSSLQITSTITNSEYEDLLKVLSTKSRWVDIEKYIGISRQELVDFNKTNVIDYLGSVVGSMTSLDLTNLIYTPCEGDSKTLNVSGTLNAEQLRILNNFIAYKNIKILQVQLPNNYFNVVSTITSTGQLIGYSVDSQSPNVAHYFYINIDLKTGEVSSATSFVYSIATSQDIKIAEDKIKTINTSITDLTARVSANESLINTINTTLGETVTKLNAVDHTASTALLIAQNRTETITYNDNASLNSALPTLEKNTLKVGDNVFIIQTDVPDWWVSAINETIGTETLPTIVGGVFNKSYHIGYFTISQLETQKVDLTNYQTKEDASLTTTNKTIVGAINEVKAGGTIVVANNGQATTQELTTLFVDSVNYSLPQGGGGGSVVTKIDYLPNNAPLQGIAIDGVNYRLAPLGSVRSNSCIALGNESTAYGNNSIASGYNSTASGYKSIALGYKSTASGNESIALGSESTASGNESTASGNSSTAYGYSSIASGYNSTASGNESIALGSNSSATGSNSSAFGYYSSVYVPSWVSIDGNYDAYQRTFTLRDTDHLFFRNENVDYAKETQSSYTNGKTLTQVLNPLGVGIKNILSIILNKDESYEIPSTIGKHHLIVIGTKTSHSEGDTDKIGLVGVTNGAIFNEDISGNKAIEIDILRTPSGYYYKVTSVGSNGVYKILSGTDTFRLVYTVTTAMTTCSINIIDEFSQGETL